MAETRARVRVAAGAAALMLLLATCGERANTGPASGGGAMGGAGTSSGSPAGGAYGGGGESSRGGYGGYGGGGAGGGQSTGGGGSSVATVGQVNFSFDPAEIAVKSGATITVDNTSPGTPHTFTIPGSDIDVTNDGGASQDVKIDLPPGTYEFVCRFHESSGMTGTITVE